MKNSDLELTVSNAETIMFTFDHSQCPKSVIPPAMLLLSTYEYLGQSNTPRLIGETGELSTAFDFNDQEVYKSCGVTHENNLFIYGGHENKRQVLQVINCSLSLIGTTPFDHMYGACDSWNGIIVLCFSYFDYKLCRQATTPLGQWSDMTLSKYEHRSTQIASSPGNLVDCRH